MTKQIKVRTCIECPYCNDKIPVFVWNKEGKNTEYLCEELNMYKLNKELPPPDDCPLEDVESHINTRTETAFDPDFDSGYKNGHEKAKQDTDKQLLDQYNKG